MRNGTHAHTNARLECERRQGIQCDAAVSFELLRHPAPQQLCGEEEVGADGAIPIEYLMNRLAEARDGDVDAGPGAPVTVWGPSRSWRRGCDLLSFTMMPITQTRKRVKRRA